MADSASFHFALETLRLEPHLTRPVDETGRFCWSVTEMGPGRLRGLRPSAAAVLAALAVAVLVVAMVDIGGGLNRPLVAPAPHAAATPAAASKS
jgi:hypothetical protein